MKNIVTKSVVQLLKRSPNKWIEFSAMVGSLSFTHFLCFSRNNIISIGIDSDESKFSENDFLSFYKNVCWKTTWLT